MDQDGDLQRDEVDCRHGSCLFDNWPMTDHTIYLPGLNTGSREVDDWLGLLLCQHRGFHC